MIQDCSLFAKLVHLSLFNALLTRKVCRHSAWEALVNAGVQVGIYVVPNLTILNTSWGNNNIGIINNR